MASTGRTGTIWIKTGVVSLAKIIVNQAEPPQEPYFYFNEESAITASTTVESTATTVDVNYLSNYISSDLTYSYDESESSWVTSVTFTDNGNQRGTITINFNESHNENSRECNIKILNNEIELGMFTLTQQGEYPFFKFQVRGWSDWQDKGTTVGPDGLTPIPQEGDDSIRINTSTSGYNNNFTVTTDNSEMFYDFENYIWSSTNKNGHCLFKCRENTSPNPRTGSVYIKHDSTVMATFTIQQLGLTKYFVFNTESATTTAVTVDSGATTTSTPCFTNYNVSEELTLSFGASETHSLREPNVTYIDNGNKTGTIIATFLENDIKNRRNGNVCVTYDHERIASFIVWQNGIEYFDWVDNNLSAISVTITYNQTISQYDYNTNYNYSELTLVPEEEYEWITQYELLETPQTINIRTSKNEDNVYSRTANFSIKKGETEVGKLTLTQNAEYPYFKFKVLNDTDWLSSGTTVQSPTLHTISKDGEIDFHIDYVQSGCNDNFTITTDNNLMFYDLVNNTEPNNPSGYCTFKCYQNPTLEEKTGTIYIKNNDAILAKLIYKQESSPPTFYFYDEGTETAVTIDNVASSTTSVTISYRTNYPALYPVCSGNYIRRAVCENGVLTATIDANGRATGRQHKVYVYTNSYHTFCAGILTINQKEADLIFYWTENLYAGIEKEVPNINPDDEGGFVYDVYDFPCFCKPGYTLEIKQESYFGNDLRWSWTLEESITPNNFHIKIEGNDFLERNVKYLIYANGENVGYLDLKQRNGADAEGDDWRYTWWVITSSPVVGDTAFCNLNIIKEIWNNETQEWEVDYDSSESVRENVQWKIVDTNIFRFEGNPDESYDESVYAYPTAQQVGSTYIHYRYDNSEPVTGYRRTACIEGRELLRCREDI